MGRSHALRARARSPYPSHARWDRASPGSGGTATPVREHDRAASANATAHGRNARPSAGRPRPPRRPAGARRRAQASPSWLARAKPRAARYAARAAPAPPRALRHGPPRLRVASANAVTARTRARPPQRKANPGEPARFPPLHRRALETQAIHPSLPSRRATAPARGDRAPRPATARASARSARPRSERASPPSAPRHQDAECFASAEARAERRRRRTP